jgi:glycosyltransferase involved in cell wall biosynthesis
VKRVLLVAYYFPPIAASGSMRPLGFCRYLEEYGWRPRVLTTSPDSLTPAQQGDDGLRRMVPPHVEVDTVPHANPLQMLIRWRGRVREQIVERVTRRPAHEPRIVSGHRPAEERRGDTRIVSVRNLADWAFAFPDRQIPWYGPAVRRIARLPRVKRPDAVFATGGPWTGLLVGKRLAERFQVPFVADFRDPWTMNPVGFQFAPWLSKRAKQLEQEICAAASRIIVNTDELRREFCAAYPHVAGKFLTITNGFDDDAVGAVMNVRDDTSGMTRDAGRVELAHFGNVYGTRNPVPLFQASTELLEEGHIRPDDLCLRFVGAWDVVDAGCEALARGLERLGVLHREGSMSREECLAEMSRSQCLLALQGEFPLQIPGKVYEYIATGRPILIIGGEGATAGLIDSERLGVCWPNRSGIIKERLASLVAGRARLEAPNSSNVQRFHYRTLTGRLADVLDAAVAK